MLLTGGYMSYIPTECSGPRLSEEMNQTIFSAALAMQTARARDIALVFDQTAVRLQTEFQEVTSNSASATMFEVTAKSTAGETKMKVLAQKEETDPEKVRTRAVLLAGLLKLLLPVRTHHP